MHSCYSKMSFSEYLPRPDRVKGWWMQPDGSYVRKTNQDLAGLRFQERFYEILQAEHRSSATKGVAID